MGDSYMDEAEEDRGNMSWLLDKGFTVGRRVLVAGFLVSSVPIVLPSLFVMSAVGLACSVPYGVLLAGYVCTEKIMSKLLPGSEPSSLEYRAKDGDDEVLDAENQPVEKVKMQLDWLEDRDEGKPVEDNMAKNDGTGELEEEESSMERGDASMGDVSAVMISIEGEAISGGNAEEEEASFEVTGVSVEVISGVGDENDEELVKETRELIENIRKEGEVENQVEKTELVAENARKGSSLAREIAVGSESELLDEKNATAQKYSQEVKGELPKKHEETADASKVTVSAAVSKPENRGTSSSKEPDLPPEKKKKNKKRVKK